MALSSLGQPNIRKCIQSALQDLPALPIVVNKILHEIDDEDVSPSHIENLARSDQALVAKILRVVNSAYYGLPGQVSSLGQAIVILGLHQVRNLVLSISALSMVKARTPRQREILRAFWLHGMATATGAQTIANHKQFESTDRELAFVAGLLHDIGKLFLFCNFTETYQEVVRYAEQHETPMTEAEGIVLGMDHQEVGKELALHWRYPEPLAILVGRHEGPFGGEPSGPLYAVHIADRMAGSLFQAEGAPLATIDPHAEAWLEYNEDQWAKLKERIDASVQAASEMFGLIAA